MPFAIKSKQTVLFTGDSITDCGRRAEHRPLGAGYVRMTTDLIIARYPRHGCRFINTGVGGDTVRMLFDRWTDDCIRHQPDWLSIMIGINDVSRWLSNAANCVSPTEFAELYDTILTRVTNETKARLVLLTPFYMSHANPVNSDGWRGRVVEALPAYITTVEKMAAKYRARLVRTHAMFQHQLQSHLPDEFGSEPVHPNPTGHLLLAHEWLKAMDW